MQNHYVGDVGDFGKYGLLRGIFQKTPACKLGIIWYLVSNGYGDRKNGSNDGRYIQYLDEEHKDRFQECDPELFKLLKKLVDEKKRCVAEIKSSRLFANTVFYSTKIDYEVRGESEREKFRGKWLVDALKKVKNCDVIFLDPDNGLEVRTPLHHSRGSKFVYYKDLDKFVGKNKTIVVYHHLTRHKNYGTHAKQILDRTKEIRKRYPGFKIWALRFWPYSPRAFFIVSRNRHKDIKNRIEAFMKTSWKKHFECYWEFGI